MTQLHIPKDLNPVGNLYPEVRSIGRVHNMAYHPTRPDLQVGVCRFLNHQQHRFENLQTCIKKMYVLREHLTNKLACIFSRMFV
jgi:hypothetical protein